MKHVKTRLPLLFSSLSSGGNKSKQIFSWNKNKYCQRISERSSVTVMVRDTFTRETHLKLNSFGNVGLGLDKERAKGS